MENNKCVIIILFVFSRVDLKFGSGDHTGEAFTIIYNICVYIYEYMCSCMCVCVCVCVCELCKSLDIFVNIICKFVCELFFLKNSHTFRSLVI